MLLRKTILVGLALCIACAGHAQSVKLTSNQILELLSGKTVVGSWSGKDYRQYFDEDGSTTFLGKDNNKIIGKWKFDQNTDELKSVLYEDQEWESWYVMEYTKDYYWVSKTTPPTQFEIENGKKLIWEKDK